MAYVTHACFEVVWDVKSWWTKTLITAGCVNAIVTATSAIQCSTLVNVCIQQNSDISVTRTRTETEITLQHTVPYFGPKLNKLQFNFINYLLDTREMELSWSWQLLWPRLPKAYSAGQLQTDEWMNEWMNEWTNERKSDWTSIWVSKWMTKWMNERIN